jgi:hypothetical protein
MVWILPNSMLFTHNIVLLVTMDKFDLNPIIVNINKLKPYNFWIQTQRIRSSNTKGKRSDNWSSAQNKL